MSSLFSLFGPTFTIPLAAVLSNGPDQIREPLLEFLNRYLTALQLERFILGVKVLAAAGLVKAINARLNAWALNNWKFSADTQKWKWPREVAVITGGSSGIGLETVKQMLAKGIKVAVFDVQDVPKELGQRECK